MALLRVEFNKNFLPGLSSSHFPNLSLCAHAPLKHLTFSSKEALPSMVIPNVLFRGQQDVKFHLPFAPFLSHGNQRQHRIAYQQTADMLTDILYAGS